VIGDVHTSDTEVSGTGRADRVTPEQQGAHKAGVVFGLAGAVRVRGGGRLSVLKPDAAGCGSIAEEAQWLPAERLRGREVSRAEAGRRETHR
jgi:hypothetical protein